MREFGVASQRVMEKQGFRYERDIIHAGLPHRFINLGPGRLQTLDIHLSPRWIQTNLE
jgi:RimJ/RimL family protein N-acetyltransferase